MKPSSWRDKGAVLFVMAFFPVIAAPPLCAQQESGVRAPTSFESLQMFSQVLNQIRVNHPDSLESHVLFAAAVEGMVRAADPHSYVLPRLRLSPEKERDLREGRLHPPPVTFSFVNGAPVVVSVAPGSEAARIDILPGDELLRVEGSPVTARSTAELEIALSGARNSMVGVTLQRRRLDGTRVELDRSIRRERTENISAVPVAELIDSRTGYVRVVNFFNRDVADDLRAALSRLERDGMQRLVLDLRDNGGGSVDEAARVAGEFLPRGAVVYTTEGRKDDVRSEGTVSRSFWSREKRYPIVVLVNRGTASAAELIAGALQDHDRGLIIGRPTFGKSLIMQGFPLTDGSMIVLVVGHLKTPCGRIVQRQYQNVSERDYHRGAGEAADTTGRPSCRTAGGRIVYGGGGIYPDIILPDPSPVPLWLSRIWEEDLPLKWMGGYVEESGDAHGSLDDFILDPVLPPEAVAAFRGFVADNGLTVPDDEDATERLQRSLAARFAMVRWGVGGYYRVLAAWDPEVREAMNAFAKAEAILEGE